MKRNGAVPVLQLTRLWQGNPGISQPWGELLAEAAAVCLQKQNHGSGVFIRVEGSVSTTVCLRCPKVEESVYLAWDALEATEYGACGVAVATVNHLTGLTVMKRSEIGDGCDYWLGEAKPDPYLYQELIPLEVSGIRVDRATEVKRRVRDKKRQLLRRSHSGYIVVLVFSRLYCHLEKI